MKTPKSLIRHKLLNTLMVINTLIHYEELNKAKKEEISDLIKLNSLLIAHEDIILGIKPKPFIQKVNLQEILDTILYIFAKKLKSKKIKTDLPNHDFFVKADRQYAKEALEQIIKNLINFVSTIKFEFNDKKKSLTILYKAKKPIKITKKSVIKCLGIAETTNDELSLQIALEILDVNKIKLSSGKSKIIITF